MYSVYTAWYGARIPFFQLIKLILSCICVVGHCNTFTFLTLVVYISEYPESSSPFTLSSPIRKLHICFPMLTANIYFFAVLQGPGSFHLLNWMYLSIPTNLWRPLDFFTALLIVLDTSKANNFKGNQKSFSVPVPSNQLCSLKIAGLYWLRWAVLQLKKMLSL